MVRPDFGVIEETEGVGHTVTNKGVEGLSKRWGEASMIRGEWTPREGSQELEDKESKERGDTRRRLDG